MADILTLQNATAYNASTLTGTPYSTLHSGAILIWFTPASGYDGTANFEVSPDSGTTWFAFEVQSGAASGTKVSSVASPAATILYVMASPSDCQFRVRMSGGTVGTLTVKAKRINEVSGR